MQSIAITGTIKQIKKVMQEIEPFLVEEEFDVSIEELDEHINSVEKILPAKKEYLVTVHTEDTDEYGAPWERKIAVDWDAGLDPDWDNWLEFFNEIEDEPYVLHSVKELDPYHIDEM